MENTRELKGKQIALTRVIKKYDDGYAVQSQTAKRFYFVDNGGACTCPDCQVNGTKKCKHAFAVQYYLQKVTTKDGVTKVETKRLTYPQAWSAYNRSQETEKARFMELLNGLAETVEEPAYEFGRPSISQKDLLFSAALKVYSQFSLRRFMTDLVDAQKKGFVEKKPCFASVGHFLQRSELTPILQKLILLSAAPLKSVETKFAIDSTGFRTTKYNEYCNEKHQEGKKHQWLKLHAVCGTKTNIVCSVKITDENGADITQFAPLIKETSENGFDMREITADKIYNSINNYNLVKEIGGQAFIPFKSGTAATCHSGNRGKFWRKMFHYFQLNQEEFMQHYHARSNIESTFSALKAKFNDMIKSKSRTAQVNELLLKVLCYNIVAVIHETNELGITTKF